MFENQLPRAPTSEHAEYIFCYFGVEFYKCFTFITLIANSISYKSISINWNFAALYC